MSCWRSNFSLLLAFFGSFLIGCSTPSSSRRPVYSSASSGIAHTLERGTIINAREVLIDGQSSYAGVWGGAVAGGTAGGTIGAEVGRTPIAASIGGGILGPKIEKALTQRRAQELTIDLGQGEKIVVVQDYQVPEFQIGEKVQLYTSGFGSKVFHDDENPFVDPETDAYLSGAEEKDSATTEELAKQAEAARQMDEEFLNPKE